MHKDSECTAVHMVLWLIPAGHPVYMLDCMKNASLAVNIKLVTLLDDIADVSAHSHHLPAVWTICCKECPSWYHRVSFQRSCDRSILKGNWHRRYSAYYLGRTNIAVSFLETYMKSPSNENSDNRQIEIWTWFNMEIRKVRGLPWLQTPCLHSTSLSWWTDWAWSGIWRMHHAAWNL